MKISNEINAFLNGQEFNNGLNIRIAAPQLSISTRWEALRPMVEGKTVLHVGFADHLDLIEEKYRNRIWLHGQLIEVAARCVGIDINAEAVDFVRNRLHIPDVYTANINERMPRELQQEKWDVVVLGEVIEHLDNPGDVLKGLQSNLKLGERKLVVTAPNFTAISNIARAINGQECVNTDHRFWFSPYTLSRLLAASGWTPKEFLFCEPSGWWRTPKLALRPKRLFRRAMLGVSPAFCETVIVVAFPRQ